MTEIDVIGTDAGAPAHCLLHSSRCCGLLPLLPQRLQTALRTGWASPARADQQRRPAGSVDSLQSELLINLVVLASGDPLWFGLGRIPRPYRGRTTRFHPAPTSLRLAFARIGRPWQDADWVSLHGRDRHPGQHLAETTGSSCGADGPEPGRRHVQQMLRSSGWRPARIFGSAKTSGMPMSGCS